MNAQSMAAVQALILFVASYKNCSFHDTYHLRTPSKAPAPWGDGQLAQSLLYPWCKRMQRALFKVNADD
ncbi:hypothetical protein AO259_16665 [Pseudomonas sp. ICMP 564]|jgi:hypothetical protein|nr:hypothetical protein AO259_16665 [Pseudomonas sp. ICMP 564]